MRSSAPSRAYAEAKKMGDLHVGDVHLVSIAETPPTYVALMVCQAQRGSQLSHKHLRLALQKLAQAARDLNGAYTHIIVCISRV